MTVGEGEGHMCHERGRDWGKKGTGGRGKAAQREMNIIIDVHEAFTMKPIPLSDT